MSAARRDDDVRENEDHRPPLLRLRLFGGFRAERDGGPALPARWPRPSAQVLVKLLAVTPGHSLHREQVQEICWPNATPRAALASLRVALHTARHALEPEIAPRAASSYLVSDGALLRLHPHHVWIDADEAERLSAVALAGAGNGTDADTGAHTAALAAFDGELLPEDRYAHWAEHRREELAALRLRVLLSLGERQLAARAYEEAGVTARRLLSDAPAEERAHQLLMSASLEQGLPSRAVRQYELCRDALAREHGIAPGPETERLRRLAAPLSSAAPARPAATPGAPPPPASVRTAADTPLRGRGELLRRIVTTTDRPLVLLGGEAGIGKTSLVARAAHDLAGSGAAVLWGAAHDTEGHTPYGPFVEALDDWLARNSSGERERIGGAHPELVPLLPSLRPAAGASPAAPGPARTGDAHDERARLFHGVERLLTEIGEESGVVVVLDDLHAADTGTHHLLARLARRAVQTGGRMRCRFLATWRDDEPVPEADLLYVEELLRAGLAHRVAVPRLSRQDALALMSDTRARLGLRPDVREPDRVWRLSLGNPLFTVELVRARAGGQGEEEASGGETPCAPDGVRHLVSRRLARLAPEARRLTEVVAVAGGTAPLAEVLDVARHGLHPPLSAAEATTALEEAVAASLLTERQVTTAGRTVTGLAFRHPLLRLTCYDLLTRLRARALHAAWGEAVLRHRPDEVDVLARHLVRAEDDRAAEFLRRAAERAAALYANEAADEYYRALAPLVAARPREAAGVGFDHGALLHRMSRYGEAAAVLRAALDAAERAGAADTAVAVAARLAEALGREGRQEEAHRSLDQWPPGPGTPADAVAAHRLARAILFSYEGRHAEAAESARASAAAAVRVGGASGSRLLGRALAQQATSLGQAQRLREAQAVAEQALAHAVEGGDPSTEALVLSILRENARRTGRLLEAVSYGERATRLADRAGSPEAGAFERTNLAELYLLLGREEEAEEFARAAEKAARAYAPRTLPYALTALARTLMAGNPAEASVLLARGEERAERTGEHQALHEVRLASAELALRDGRPARALELLDRTAATPRAACLRGWALLGAGRHAEAVALMEREVERAEEAGRRLLGVEATLVLALALGLSGEADRAASAFADARAKAGALPYPSALARVRAAGETLLTAPPPARTSPTA
ncbi:ATP-binding protein [Streptomyces sp. NPDC088090]|uniref:ATP-binding protein n=1 Tax=Streptomyces sp. NPDC088090 TaxID=3365822 RepID=UPI00384BFE01